MLGFAAISNQANAAGLGLPEFIVEVEARFESIEEYIGVGEYVVFAEPKGSNRVEFLFVRSDDAGQNDENIGTLRKVRRLAVATVSADCQTYPTELKFKPTFSIVADEKFGEYGKFGSLVAVFQEHQSSGIITHYCISPVVFPDL